MAKKTKDTSSENVSLAKSVAKKKTTRIVRSKKTSFSKHIERIREAKELSDNVSANIVPLDARAASVSLLWEIVFDILCNSSELEISDFNTVAGIIQKLASSRVAEIPTVESTRQSINEERSISPEVLARIEEQLKLL